VERAPLTPPQSDAPRPTSTSTFTSTGTGEPLVVTNPGWGWRVLIAFVAGGVLTAAGFAVGARVTSDQNEVQPAPTTSSAVPVASATSQTTTAPSGVPPVADDGIPPAQHVAEVLGPSVVQITTDFGIGSGVVYGDGLILTNHHVVNGATGIVVQISDGRRFVGEVVGSEPNVDIAVVSVGEGHDLPIAQLASGEKPEVGELAIAIGSPFSLQQSVTEGIVSAIDRPVENGDYYVAMIQTDAAINPGNSGGALADRFGRVIGINTAILSGLGSGVNAGVGFAVPIDTAVSVADRLLAGEPIEPGFLGVRGRQPADGSAGVELTEITPESAAASAGLRAGDRVLSIDGVPVAQFEELAGLVTARQPGERVALEVVRAGQTLTVEVDLGRRP
jgi:S1-C subfamily serine protease